MQSGKAVLAVWETTRSSFLRTHRKREQSKVLEQTAGEEQSRAEQAKGRKAAVHCELLESKVLGRSSSRAATPCGLELLTL